MKELSFAAGLFPWECDTVVHLCTEMAFQSIRPPARHINPDKKKCITLECHWIADEETSACVPRLIREYCVPPARPFIERKRLPAKHEARSTGLSEPGTERKTPKAIRRPFNNTNISFHVPGQMLCTEWPVTCSVVLKTLKYMK